MNTNAQSRVTPGFFSALFLTILSIGIIFVLDRNMTDVTVAPVAGLLALFILAFRYSPKIVALCLLPLWVFVSFSLWNAISPENAQPSDMPRFLVRMVTFGIGGIMAVVAASYRSRLDRLIVQLLGALEAIPIPLLVCDASGKIISASNATVSASGVAKDSILGFRLADIAGYHLLEEAEEDWYKHWILSPEGKIFDAELQLGNLRSNVKAGRIGSGRHAIMIVIFI